MKTSSEKNTLWIVVGTRPNFVKITQFKRTARESFPSIEVKIVHTGQHYDERMAGVFFDKFGLRPDVFLDVAPGMPGFQIAEAITGLTRLFAESKPDLVMVVGDVNSTLAGAVAADKCGITAAHLESGLRSGDLSMPEERNRKVADVLCDLHFVTEDSGLANLRAEGISERGIAFTGNTMIDTLSAFSSEIAQSEVTASLGLEKGKFALATIHRPSNVDNPEGAKLVTEIFRRISARRSVVFPIHPRTAARFEAFGLKEELESLKRLKMIEPQDYFAFQKLIADSAFVLTDSGGIQEETTFLQKPCLTLRPNTERPSTIEIGSNTLLKFDPDSIEAAVDEIDAGTYKKGRVPHLWDGKATERVLRRMEDFFENGY